MDRAKNHKDQTGIVRGGRGRPFFRVDTHRRNDSPFAKIERRALEIRCSKRREKIERIRSGSRQKNTQEEEDGFHTGKENLEDKDIDGDIRAQMVEQTKLSNP